jgi:RsiW-degrading membrane proteinase PrsW (M82 family)
MNINILAISFIVGILPAIIWLWFWLKEDKKHPEPKRYIALTFIIGMFSTVLVLPLEKYIVGYFTHLGIIATILLSMSEEVFKFLAAYVSALRYKFVDEPIDPAIYLITAALGFAAAENIFFIFNTLKIAPLFDGILIGNMRFVGATVLHTISSGIIGLFMGLAFYKSKLKKLFYLILGFIFSIALHTSFNFFIIIDDNNNVSFAFIYTWIVAIFFILFFEKIKKLKN